MDIRDSTIYDGRPTPCIYPDLMMRLQIKQGITERRVVWYWLQTPLVRHFIEQKAKGTSPTMKKISQKVVMAIPYPTSLPIIEQNKIIEKLDSLQEETDNPCFNNLLVNRSSFLRTLGNHFDTCHSIS